jgi:excisionase family DNA binding protein
MMEEKLLSVDDVCEYLGIGRDTIYKWIAAKSLPAYRLGRLWKFKKKEVDKWIKRCSC